jgi:hypothetical protein
VLLVGAQGRAQARRVGPRLAERAALEGRQPAAGLAVEAHVDHGQARHLGAVAEGAGQRLGDAQVALVAAALEEAGGGLHRLGVEPHPGAAPADERGLAAGQFGELLRGEGGAAERHFPAVAQQLVEPDAALAAAAAGGGGDPQPRAEAGLGLRPPGRDEHAEAALLEQGRGVAQEAEGLLRGERHRGGRGAGERPPQRREDAAGVAEAGEQQRLGVGEAGGQRPQGALVGVGGVDLQAGVGARLQLRAQQPGSVVVGRVLEAQDEAGALVAGGREAAPPVLVRCCSRCSCAALPRTVGSSPKRAASQRAAGVASFGGATPAPAQMRTSASAQACRKSSSRARAGGAACGSSAAARHAGGSALANAATVGARSPSRRWRRQRAAAPARPTVRPGTKRCRASAASTRRAAARNARRSSPGGAGTRRGAAPAASRRPRRAAARGWGRASAAAAASADGPRAGARSARTAAGPTASTGATGAPRAARRGRGWGPGPRGRRSRGGGLGVRGVDGRGVAALGPQARQRAAGTMRPEGGASADAAPRPTAAGARRRRRSGIGTPEGVEGGHAAW